jgi:hypothetical protein
MIETSRRKFITGLVSFVGAPAIVRASSLMPIKFIEDRSCYIALYDPVIIPVIREVMPNLIAYDICGEVMPNLW